jgi:hypothetical protein
MSLSLKSKASISSCDSTHLYSFSFWSFARLCRLVFVSGGMLIARANVTIAPDGREHITTLQLPTNDGVSVPFESHLERGAHSRHQFAMALNPYT